MARRIDWTGVYVPAVTPFTETGEINEAGFRQVVDAMIAEGADGIIVAGCTGEWFSMNDAERSRLFAVAREHIAGPGRVHGPDRWRGYLLVVVRCYQERALGSPGHYDGGRGKAAGHGHQGVDRGIRLGVGQLGQLQSVGYQHVDSVQQSVG